MLLLPFQMLDFCGDYFQPMHTNRSARLEMKMTNKVPHWMQVHRRGWTLIELITTVTILTIVAVVIIPYAASGSSPMGQSVARMVVTDILAAQMDAITNQEYRRIHFFEGGNGWCVEVIDSDQLNEAYDSDTAQYAVDVVESHGQNQRSIKDFSVDGRFRNIFIEDVVFDGVYRSITFDPTGGIVAPDGSPSTGGSFEVHSGEFSWKISLAPLTGKVVVVDLGGGI